MPNSPAPAAKPLPQHQSLPRTQLLVKTRQKNWLLWELLIVLLLSYGIAGLRAIVNISERLTSPVQLAKQTAKLHEPMAYSQIFDLLYYLLSIIGGLAPVGLVVLLLWQTRPPHLSALGLGKSAPGAIKPRRSGWITESGWGVLLAAGIGIPGLAFYIFANALGINTTVIPTQLNAYWWTVPVLVLSALRASLGEELIVVAYFYHRLRLLGASALTTIMLSALLRGSYHLYQGFGGFIGNVVMGALFAWVYHRYGRSLPLIIAHWILDIVSFVGFPLALWLWPDFPRIW